MKSQLIKLGLIFFFLTNASVSIAGQPSKASCRPEIAKIEKQQVIDRRISDYLQSNNMSYTSFDGSSEISPAAIQNLEDVLAKFSRSRVIENERGDKVFAKDTYKNLYIYQFGLEDPSGHFAKEAQELGISAETIVELYGYVDWLTETVNANMPVDEEKVEPQRVALFLSRIQEVASPGGPNHVDGFYLTAAVTLKGLTTRFLANGKWQQANLGDVTLFSGRARRIVRKVPLLFHGGPLQGSDRIFLSVFFLTKSKSKEIRDAYLLAQQK